MDLELFNTVPYVIETTPSFRKSESYVDYETVASITDKPVATSSRGRDSTSTCINN